MAQLRMRKGRYYFPCQYNEAPIAQRAGFDWDAERKLFYSDDIIKAKKLQDYADNFTSNHLKTFDDRYLLSRALVTDFEPKTPPVHPYKPYQKVGIEYCMGLDRSLIADPMGAGKTATAIGICNEHGSDTILILCPAVVKEGWWREIETWYLGDKNVQIVYGRSAKISPKANIIIINYELIIFENYLEQFARRRFDHLICDEVHYLKELSSKRTVAALSADALSGIARKHIALSGTPVKARPVEFWPLLYSWRPEVIHPYVDYMSYGRKFCKAHLTEFGWDFKGSSNVQDLMWRLRSMFMVRRPKSAFRDSEPNIIIKPLKIKNQKAYEEKENIAYGSADSRKLLKKRIGQFLNVNQKDKAKALKELGQLQKNRHILLEDKMPEIVKFIKDLLESGVDKLVVFGHHRSGMQSLYAEFKKYNPVLHIGGLTSAQRGEILRKFQKDPTCRVYFANTGAAGTGLDGLQHVCSYAVFIEPDSDVTGLHQCISRLDRTGQKEQVTAYLLTVFNSLDEAHLRLCYEKEDTFKKLMGD